MLCWISVQAAVLDGGWQTWLAADGPAESGGPGTLAA
jgi:3-mercaptopyruvate sulfurtransferase SseA